MIEFNIVGIDDEAALDAIAEAMRDTVKKRKMEQHEWDERHQEELMVPDAMRELD
jgi:hypothetical protein